MASCPSAARSSPAATPPTLPGKARTAGQGGAVLVLVQLWQSFGLWGADHWTPDQSAQRWPAVTAGLVLAVATAQNLAGWWRGR